MKTHSWSKLRDCLKADPARWERIEAGKAALRAMHELFEVNSESEQILDKRETSPDSRAAARRAWSAGQKDR